MATTTDTFDWTSFLKSLNANAAASGTAPLGSTTTTATNAASAAPSAAAPATTDANAGSDDWSKQFDAMMKDLNASIGGVVNQDPTQAAQKAAAAQRAYLVATIPGYEQLAGQALSNIESGLKGEVPESAQIAQAAREQGVGTGSRGPGAYLAALGLRSADVQNQALQNFQSWQKQMTPDVSNFVATPAQQLEFQTNIASISTKLLDIESALQSKQLDRNQELELEKLKEQFQTQQTYLENQLKKTPTVVSGNYSYDPVSDTWVNLITGEQGKGPIPRKAASTAGVSMPGYG